jgi:hypothetical protein
MQAPTQGTDRKQAVVTRRVIAYYQRAIGRLLGRSQNSRPVRSDIECMRMCVDAVDRPAGQRNSRAA